MDTVNLQFESNAMRLLTPKVGESQELRIAIAVLAFIPALLTDAVRFILFKANLVNGKSFSVIDKVAAIWAENKAPKTLAEQVLDCFTKELAVSGFDQAKMAAEELLKVAVEGFQIDADDADALLQESIAKTDLKQLARGAAIDIAASFEGMSEVLDAVEQFTEQSFIKKELKPLFFRQVLDAIKSIGLEAKKVERAEECAPVDQPRIEKYLSLLNVLSSAKEDFVKLAAEQTVKQGQERILRRDAAQYKSPTTLVKTAKQLKQATDELAMLTAQVEQAQGKYQRLLGAINAFKRQFKLETAESETLIVQEETASRKALALSAQPVVVQVEEIEALVDELLAKAVSKAPSSQPGRLGALLRVFGRP